VGIIGVSILLVFGYFIARSEQKYQANLYSDAGMQKKLGNYKEAQKKYSAITKINKNNANAFFELGDTHQKLGEYDKAIEAYRNAIETDPEYILPKINLTAVYLIEERFKEADDLIKEVLKEKEISPQYTLAMRFINISSHLMQKEKHEGLIDQIRGFMDYYRSLTEDYVRNWDYRLSRNLVEKFPLKGQKRSLLLKFYDILESSWEEGRQKLDESEASVYNIIGHASLALRKNDEAIKAFKKAVELDPKKLPFKTNLAAAYLIAKHFKEADELAKEILKGKISVEYQLIMRGVSIASLLFQERNQQANNQLKEFARFYKSIKSDYEPTWDYSSAKELISSSTLKFEQKVMLLKFLQILESSLEEGRREIDKLNL
jgi:tetratricopeptide (TPR) repeat protein